MVYVETKTVNGRKYRYLRKTVRNGERTEHITLKYLGPVNPIYKVSKKRKTNASIFVRSIAKEEKEKLSQALHSSNAFIRDRAKIILLSSKGLSAIAIALKVGCEARKVRIAIKVFNQEGLKALQKKKAKGAAQKFSEFDRKAILIHFSKKPSDFKIPISYWTLPRFRKHLVDSKVVESISIDTIRRILIKAKAKLEKSKRWQYSPDKNFLKKSRQ